MYDVNVFGPMEIVRQFTPLLFPVQGTIVNIGSQFYVTLPLHSFQGCGLTCQQFFAGILGIMPYPLTAVYNGSKAALAQYSETLRLELEPLKIKVVTVVTGQVGSNLPTIPHLGETSIYKSLGPALAARTKTHQGKITFPIHIHLTGRV